jgi:hypothetical protein
MNKHLVRVGWLVAGFAAIYIVAPGFMPATGQEKSEKLLRHVVLFKFKPDVTADQVKQVTDAFSALPSKIDAIHSFEWGTDVSVENKADGFTHCFLVTFRSLDKRGEYLPHQAHQDFIKIAGPRIDKVLVVDYWAGK